MRTMSTIAQLFHFWAKTDEIVVDRLMEPTTNCDLIGNDCGNSNALTVSTSIVFVVSPLDTLFRLLLCPCNLIGDWAIAIRMVIAPLRFGNWANAIQLEMIVDWIVFDCGNANTHIASFSIVFLVTSGHGD